MGVYQGSTLQENNLLPWEQILSFKDRLYFERAAFSRKANRNLQKLLPFVKMIETHGGVPVHLNSRRHMIGTGVLEIKWLKQIFCNIQGSCEVVKGTSGK